MVPKEFLQQAEALATRESQKFNTPPMALIAISFSKAQDLATRLNADKDIVQAGIWLMDVQLGRAMAQGKGPEHIAMGVNEAQKLLKNFPEIPTAVQENILACVAEHHGAAKFSTIESEICCNADCYRFASVQGFITAIRNMRDMPFESLIQILNDKLEEKWKALSLKVCIDELESQYKLIKQLLKKI